MDDLKNQGVDEVIVFCVNDGAVMDAWERDQKCGDNTFITFMGDPKSDFVRALDLELKHPGPNGKGLWNRGKRAAIYAVNGVAKIVRVAEKPDDPAGDDFPEITLAEAMEQAIASFKSTGHDSEL